MKKICDVVTPEFISRAAMMGPITRDPFTDTEDRLMEPPRSSGGTRLGSTAENAGALSELPMPTTSCAANRTGIAASIDEKMPRHTEPVIWMTWANTSHLRLSNLSAMTPAGMESSRSGPSWAKVKIATVEALLVRE